MTWLGDSKAAEQKQCRPGAISSEPCVPVKITQDELHTQGASSIDLAGEYLSDLYAQGGRDAAYAVEFARLTTASKTTVRNARHIAHARRYLPEVEARLNVSTGMFRRQLAAYRPAATVHSDWYSTVMNMQLLPVASAPSDDEEQWYMVTTDAQAQKLGFGKSQPRLKSALEGAVDGDHWSQRGDGGLLLSRSAVLVLLSGAHMVVDNAAILVVSTAGEPTDNGQHMSLSGRMALTVAIDALCGAVNARGGDDDQSEDDASTCVVSQRAECVERIASAFAMEYERPAAEHMTSSAVEKYARTTLKATISNTGTSRVSELVSFKCKLSTYASKECNKHRTSQLLWTDVSSPVSCIFESPPPRASFDCRIHSQSHEG